MTLFPNEPGPAVESTGRRLCLEFTNTVSMHSVPETEAPAQPVTLAHYDELVGWAVSEGGLDAGAARLLSGLSSGDAEAAGAVFRRAIDFREALYRVFEAQIEGTRCPDPDLAVVNGVLHVALEHVALGQQDGGYTWSWTGMGEDLGSVLWPIAVSAARLLASEDLELVRRCAGDRCDWLFLDTSRNHSRRWCSMSDCGNRSKVKRFYARQRGSRPGTR
ncbi:MAG: CGNR zinc finger domain-containing protein [Chloroflexi bacterium]|nr:CGNR zinc finger domain-containing protein [Chloroflexota bacterium]